MYTSPTYGQLTIDEVFQKVKLYILSDPEAEYSVMIGCDSQQHSRTLSVVSAIIVHRVGKGAIYFTERTELPRTAVSLREKIYIETSMSLEIANYFKTAVLSDDDFLVDISVHLDIGKTGKTSSLIKELVSYVKSCGYEVCIKDDSRFFDCDYHYPIAASSVADRYSK
jgi:predicted RNase H-related nuclease YkuK (DUF458 family)